MAKSNGSGSVTSNSSAARRGSAVDGPLGVDDSGTDDSMAADRRWLAWGFKGKVDTDARYCEGVESVCTCAESVLVSSSMTYNILSFLRVSRTLYKCRGRTVYLDMSRPCTRLASFDIAHLGPFSFVVLLKSYDAICAEIWYEQL